jgi:methyl-CpG-binding domain protein 4
MIKKISPHNLLQEIYRDKPWRILISCIFLNQTSRIQVDVIRDKFFCMWPTPYDAAKADPIEMSEVIKSLGFKNKRTDTIIKMSQGFIKDNWVEPKELYGIGQYGQDSWDIFVKGNIDIKNPSDHVLKKYINWAKKETNGKF